MGIAMIENDVPPRLEKTEDAQNARPSKKNGSRDIQLPDLEQQVGELVAAYEITMEKLAQKEKALELHFQASDSFLNDQLEKMNLLIVELGEMITEAGAARWRLSAQDALRLGDLQLSTVKKLSEETKNLMNDSCARYEKAALAATKNLKEAIAQFKMEEYKTYTENCAEEVKKNSSVALQKITDIFSWFQWKNMALCLGFSIIAAVVIGLYIDDEWPWELHSKVVKERAAGQALMNAWPHLDPSDHQYLEGKLQEAAKRNN
jgi:hypothetical protein